jgi:hypothetical protein
MSMIRFQGFAGKIVIPYSAADEKHLEAVRTSLKNQDDILRFLDTAEFSHLTNRRVTLGLGTIEVGADFNGKAGAMVSHLEISGENLSINDVSSFFAAFNRWVKKTLVINRAEKWLRDLYFVLLISGTVPQITSKTLEDNRELQSDLIMAAVSPKNLPFTNRAILEMSSRNLGYLATNFYKFSPYGALIFDSLYRESKDYVESIIVPIIARTRATQVLFEFVNQYLVDELGKLTEKSAREHWEKLTILRETVLKALAGCETSRSMVQLVNLSNILWKQFGIDKSMNSVQYKIEVLDSLLSGLIDERLKGFERRISFVNVLLSLISVLLALLAIPAFYAFLKEVFFN